MPNSNETGLAGASLPLTACSPSIPGYSPVILTDTEVRGVNLGIWASSAEPRRTKVVVYSSNFRCDGRGPDDRYRVLVSSSVSWRLAALRRGLHLPPDLILLSEAAVGEPLTFAVFNLRPGVFSFRDRRPPR